MWRHGECKESFYLSNILLRVRHKLMEKARDRNRLENLLKNLKKVNLHIRKLGTKCQKIERIN